MIKLIAVDLDGTLADLKKAHYAALNSALLQFGSQYEISEQEQLEKFEGLSTKRKLEILVQERSFPPEHSEAVFDLKQLFTATAIENTLAYDPPLVSTFSRLKQEGFLLFIASNAIRASIEAALKKLGIFEFFDKILSNEDVQNTKPHPEIYLRAMVEAGVAPEETLIIEDSRTGRESALRSKAHLCEVDTPTDTRYQHIKDAIRQAEEGERPLCWYARHTCNILIPMAGAGSRMRAQYNIPKPLIDVNGKSMIHRVVENLNIDAHYIFIVQKEHNLNYNISNQLRLIAPNCDVIELDHLTQGAACTTLLAKDLINNSKQLIIANCDQLVEWNSSSFMYSMLSSEVDGQILTFIDSERNPKWSFARIADGLVTEVAEKNPISDLATVGIYGWRHGSDYVKYAEQMIKNNMLFNNEYYVCPVYNEAIRDGKKISTFNINKMIGLGTLEDLESYLALANGN